MINFGTADFNAKVATFKADFVGHEQLYRYGQFYLTRRATDEIIGQIEISGLRGLVLQLHGDPQRL